MFLLIWNAQIKKDFLPLFFSFAPEYQQRRSDAVSNFERATLQEKVATKLLYVCTTTLVHKVEYQFNLQLLSIEKRLTKADVELLKT